MLGFRFGSFYGLTAPVAVLSERHDLEKMFDNIKTGVGLDLLNNLKLELYYMEEVLNNGNIIMEEDFVAWYTNLGEIIQSKNVRQTKRYIGECRNFFKGAPTIQKDFKPLHTQQQWESIEEEMKKYPMLLKDMVRVDGDLKQLSPEGYKLLNAIYSNAQMMQPEGVTKLNWLINRLSSLGKSGSSGTQKFFDMPIYKLVSMNGIGGMNKTVNENYSQSINILKGIGRKNSIDAFYSDITSLLDLGYGNEVSENNPLAVNANLNKEFIARIQEQGNVKENEMVKLYHIWTVVRTMSMRLLQYLTGSESVEAIDKAISELADAGIVGISYVQEEFLFSQSKVINSHEEESNKSLEKNTPFFQNLVVMHQDILSKKEEFTKGVVVLE